MNQVVLVGRICTNPEMKETENGKKMVNILLAVPRSFKNQDGEYETDFLPCSIWEAVAANVNEYCNVGDLIGVKGRLVSNIYEKDDKKHYEIELVAEKVTFLSSKPKDEEEPKKKKAE